LALAAAGLSCSRALAADKPAQTIPGFGTVVDPDGDCGFADRVKLTIKVPNTLHGLTYRPEPGQSKLNAPRLVQDVKGDFQFAIKVLAFPITKTKASTSGRPCHLSAGLLVWQDDRNFMRMERAGSAGLPQPFVFLERFENGQSAWRKKLSIENKDTYLRVTRTGDTFTFENSEDGQDWNKIQTEDAKLPEQVKTGVHAINSSIEVFSPTIEVPAPAGGEGSPTASDTADKPAQVVRTLS
jgi:regulation of enolase protein 1 (concanavalin A-like superfamily)